MALPLMHQWYWHYLWRWVLVHSVPFKLAIQAYIYYCICLLSLELCAYIFVLQGAYGCILGTLFSIIWWMFWCVCNTPLSHLVQWRSWLLCTFSIYIVGHSYLFYFSMILIILSSLMWLTYACFISFAYTYDSFHFVDCLISIIRISFDHIPCFHILDLYLSRFAWTYVVFTFVFLLLLVFVCLYLFTGLFKLSRISFPAAGF